MTLAGNGATGARGDAPAACDVPPRAPVGPADFRALFEQMPGRCVAVAADAPRYTILAATDAYCRDARVSREAMLGRGLFELFGDQGVDEPGAPQHRAEAGLRASFAEALRSRTPHRPVVQRFDVVGPDGRGEVRHWQPLTVPVLGEDGQVRYLLHQVDHVSDAVVRQEAAVEAARRAERILDQVSDEHLTMDADFRILTVNAAAERALGRARDELRGLTHWEAFPASIGTAAERHYRRAMAERIDVHFEQHYVGEGYDRQLEIDAYPTDEGGLALFWRDVSERVRAQRALAESEARLRAIYDGTYEYIGLIAPDGTVLDCNRASLVFVDVPREQILGQPFWETPWFAHTPGAAELVRAAVSRAAAGEFVRQEMPLRRPSGETLTFDFSLHPVRDAQGDVAFIVPEGRDITERVRAEAALRESETRYRILFDSLDEGFCVIEMLFDEHDAPVDYRFVEANPAFVHQTGFTDAIGRRMRELVPEHEAHWFEAYGRVAVTGESTRFEAAAAALHRWYDVYAFRIGRPEERKVAVLFRDVAEAHAAERERERLLGVLEVERARLFEVFHRAPSFIAVFRGPEQVYEFANEAYYQLVGHREIVGRPLLEALPEIRDQGFAEVIELVRQTGEPWLGREIPVELQRTPGAPIETRYVDTVFQLLAEADGTRSGVVVHGSDVTEQVIARRDVEAARAELAATLESISDAFYAVDADFRFTYVNRKAEELWGRRREELLGRHYWTEFPAAVGSESYHMDHRVMAERRPLHYETRSPLVDGWVEVSLYPTAGGGLSCYFRDIADRKAAEDERERLLAAERTAREEAEGANRAKSEFLAVMSHELRTPLNAIDGYAELMELGIRGPLTEPQRQDLARIRRSQRHLLGLVNGVLNYSRVEAGAVRYDLEDVWVHEALGTCEALVAPQARARELVLRFRSCTPPQAVRADREKLQQVVLNLLSNAVKFTEPGGRVDVACVAAADHVAITITDTGRGIAPDHLDRIFEPFVQVDASRTRTSEGVGLGLAISRDLARGMGGDLTAESAFGRGSTFTLTLPRA